MNAEEHAWELLAGLDPREVSDRSLSVFDPSDGAFSVKVFGIPVTVAMKSRTMSSATPDGELILTKKAYFSRLSILHYLAGSQAIPFSGQLVRPSDLKVGALYFRGSHVLPLDAIAARFGCDVDGFIGQGTRFGGERRTYGDASVALAPLPRLPVTLILWRGDEEFPARADLLLDATCERHVPPDILWSVAMLTVGVMLTAPAGKKQ